MRHEKADWWLWLIMARFATFISDPELEALVIKGISAIQGELFLRGVSKEQLEVLPSDVVLIQNSPNNLNGEELKRSIRSQIFLVERNATLDSIIDQLTPQFANSQNIFHKGSAKAVAFIGLSGGVGTTTLAINYAFETAMDSQVALVDLDERFPEIAKNLNLHRIDGRPTRVGSNLQVCQGVPEQLVCDLFVLDLGANVDHPNLEAADAIYVVARLNENSLDRLQQIKFKPTGLICNFFGRSRQEERRIGKIQSEFPQLPIFIVPQDSKAFDLASEMRSALLEVAPNSLARKHIATLD